MFYNEETMPHFDTKPNEFVESFIIVNGRVMIWQNNVSVVGYVYLP